MATSPFMFSNPQKKVPTQQSGPMSVYTPPAAGVRAVSPTTTVRQSNNTLPATQQAPVKQAPVQTASAAYNAPASAPLSSGADTNLQLRPGESPDQYRARVAIYQGSQAPAQAQQPVQPTYPGLMGQLIQNAQGTRDQAGNINTTAQQIGTQGQMTPEELNARKRLADLTGIASDVQTNIESHPSDFAFQMGREAVAKRNIDARNQSLAQTLQALTSQREAATTAYTGQANAQGQAGGLLTSAGNQYSSAAGLAQPQVTGYGQTSFDPLTGSFGDGSGNLDPQSQASTFAKNVINGSMTYDQAVASMGYAGGAGKTFLDNALTQAGGNPLQLQASGSANQAIIGDQTQTVAGYQSALQQGQNLQAQLTDLITTFGLNPGDVNAVNVGLQKIANNVSDPRYKMLQNYVNDIANTYAQILTPPGGSATDTTRGIAASMLDETASGKSLIQVMGSLDEAAKAKIAGVPTSQSTQGSQSNSGDTVGWY